MTRFSGPAPAFGTPEMRSEFLLDPSYIATNHGSFGAPPRKVLEERARITLEIEANPDLFCKVNYHHELNAALEPVSHLLGLGGDVDELVFATNATTGINAVMRSLKQILSATGRHPIPSSLRTQKILYFSTVYGNVLNGINYTSSNDTFSSIQLQITYPISTKSILSLIESTIATERANGNDIVLAIYDAITSVPGVTFPFTETTALLKSHGILTCIDAAHAIGQVPFNLSKVKPDFFVTNLHKWLYVPRGAAVFYCARRFHGVIRHPVIS
ncbi:hypothetical protein HDU99_004376, partial [Rhizoclosmatium hyalinum]